MLELVSVQLPPPSLLYWYSVMGVPPSLLGATQSRSTNALPRVATRLVGAPGVMAASTGVALTPVEAGPVPLPLTARIRKL